MQTELPLNRKERFYTGTVFPMIVCKDNFKYFNLFLKLIEGIGQIDIDPNPNTTNIQFFTEYSLVESLFGNSKERFRMTLSTKDTPDILILITGKVKTLIALEAKMYDYPKLEALELQMNKQKEILKCICENLEIEEDKVFHYALLPHKYAVIADKRGIKTIKWESIVEVYRKVFPEDYFVELLDYSLNQYDELVGKGIDSFGKHCEARIVGQIVFDNFKSDNLIYKTIGRNKGLEGFMNDINSGNWRIVEYEMNFGINPPSRNWITVEKFVSLIEEKR